MEKKKVVIQIKKPRHMHGFQKPGDKAGSERHITILFCQAFKDLKYRLVVHITSWRTAVKIPLPSQVFHHNLHRTWIRFYPSS